MKLNLGCGNTLIPGWVNIDRKRPKNVPPGVEFRAMNLERFEWVGDSVLERFELEGDSVSEMLLSHVLEHLDSPLDLLDRLYLVAEHGCRLEVRVPHGRSDEAWEDQTHKRAYFPGSFKYFAQSTYTFGDYGYRANWLAEEMTLVAKPGSALEASLQAGRSVYAVGRAVHAVDLDAPNQVLEIRCTLVARKDGRPLGETALSYATLNRPDLAEPAQKGP